MTNYLLGLALLTAVVMAVVYSAAAAPGKQLAGRVRSLGHLIGKSRAEITAALGPHNAMQGIDEGKIIYTWARTGYFVTMRFKDDICEGIVAEQASNAVRH